MQRNSGQPVLGTRKFARVRVITLTLLVVFIAPTPAAAAWRLPVSRAGLPRLLAGREPVCGRPPPRRGPLCRAGRARARAMCRAGGGGRPGGVERRRRHGAVRPLAGQPVAPLNNSRAARRAGQRPNPARRARPLCRPRGPPPGRAPRRRAVRLRRPAALPRRDPPGRAATARPRAARPPARTSPRPAGPHRAASRRARAGASCRPGSGAPHRPGAGASRRPGSGAPHRPGRTASRPPSARASRRARAAPSPRARALARVGRARTRAGRCRRPLAVAPARAPAGWRGARAIAGALTSMCDAEASGPSGWRLLHRCGCKRRQGGSNPRRR